MGNDCDTCAFYTYDQDYEDYVCDVDMDEDEYAVVRHQM